MDYHKMPLNLVAKCSAKLEAHLMKHAKEIQLDPSSLHCFLPSYYGGFGGFGYLTKVKHVTLEICITHNSGDRFTVHMIYLSYFNGADHARCADTFTYDNLIAGIQRFLNVARFEFDVV